MSTNIAISTILITKFIHEINLTSFCPKTIKKNCFALRLGRVCYYKNHYIWICMPIFRTNTLIDNLETRRLKLGTHQTLTDPKLYLGMSLKATNMLHRRQSERGTLLWQTATMQHSYIIQFINRYWHENRLVNIDRIEL